MLLAQCSTAEAIKLLITSDLSERYQSFVDNRNILEIDNYNSSEKGHQLAEVVLFHQAIALGGYKKVTELWENTTASYTDRVRFITSAKVAAMGVTGWKVEALAHSDLLHISSPIIRQGEYQVGLYTRSDNQTVLSTKKMQDLEHLTAVTNRNWSADWKTLNNLPLKKIYNSQRWMAHLKMLATNRADIMLLPFQNSPDLSLHYNPTTRAYLPNNKQAPNDSGGIRLIPIPGIKIRVNGERCFYVSKLHPEGAAIYIALESGLRQLRQRGTIVRAMQESKFFHPATSDWVIIN